MSLPQPREDSQIREIAVVEPGLVATTPAERAWSEIYERLYPRFLRAAERVLDADAAEEAVQDGLFRAFERWPTLAPENRTDAYIRTAVWSRVVNECIRQQRHVEYTLELEEQEAVPVLRPHDADGGDDVAMIVDETIAAMPPQRRAVYVLFHEEGLTIREAAEALGIGYETARTHMKLANVWLKKHMPKALQGYQLGRSHRELTAGVACRSREEAASNE